MSKGKLIGEAPKVGIRPAIDGRQKGVRESLEEQTMLMARSAADLIESSLKHANGSKVECVIADSCIGGVAEAAAAADKFSLWFLPRQYRVHTKSSHKNQNMKFHLYPFWEHTILIALARPAAPYHEISVGHTHTVCA